MAAHALALGLLEADARDYDALMILSRAEMELGRPKKSEIAARLAWRVAETSDQKFAAAYTRSQALSRQERYGAAQWWLRQAGQASDRPVFDRAAKAQFARVRADNPMTTQLTFSVNPLSNINGAPTTNTFTIGGVVLPNASGRAQSTIDLTLGYNFYVHDPLAQYARLDLGRDWALSDGRLAGPGLSYRDQKRHDISARPSETLRFSGYWRTPVADKGTLTLGVPVADTTSASSAIAHDAVVASVNYAPAAEVLGTQGRFSLAVVGREYDRARYGTSPRSDRKVVAGAEFTFSKLEYMSFAPTLGLNYARTQSNVSLFDSREFGLSLGFRSTF